MLGRSGRLLHAFFSFLIQQSQDFSEWFCYLGHRLSVTYSKARDILLFLGFANATEIRLNFDGSYLKTLSVSSCGYHGLKTLDLNIHRLLLLD